MTDLKQAPLTDTVRAVCDLLDQHQLRPLHLGFGTGGPRYVDVSVATWQAVANWAGQLGLTDIRRDGCGTATAHGDAHGFAWMICSREKDVGVLLGDIHALVRPSGGDPEPRCGEDAGDRVPCNAILDDGFCPDHGEVGPGRPSGGEGQ